MKSFMRNKKGFTLIELLIVIVILGILAALVLPRMFAQPERAITAEAINYLGVIRRAEETYAQTAALPGVASYITACSGCAITADVAAWGTLGLSPLPTGSRFSYACVGGTGVASGPFAIPTGNAPPASNVGTCTATRVGTAGTGRAGGTITINLFDGLFSCDGTIYTMPTTGATVPS